jgi:hypothetical protein
MGVDAVMLAEVVEKPRPAQLRLWHRQLQVLFPQWNSLYWEVGRRGILTLSTAYGRDDVEPGKIFSCGDTEFAAGALQWDYENPDPTWLLQVNGLGRFYQKEAKGDAGATFRWYCEVAEWLRVTLPATVLYGNDMGFIQLMSSQI